MKKSEIKAGRPNHDFNPSRACRGDIHGSNAMTMYGNAVYTEWPDVRRADDPDSFTEADLRKKSLTIDAVDRALLAEFFDHSLSLRELLVFACMRSSGWQKPANATEFWNRVVSEQPNLPLRTDADDIRNS